MNMSLETMLLLCMLLPLVAIVGIVGLGHKPNWRETVTISTCLALIYLVVNLYQGLADGEIIRLFLWEIFPGLQLSFVVEPLGMLWA